MVELVPTLEWVAMAVVSWSNCSSVFVMRLMLSAFWRLLVVVSLTFYLLCTLTTGLPTLIGLEWSLPNADILIHFLPGMCEVSLNCEFRLQHVGAVVCLCTEATLNRFVL